MNTASSTSVGASLAAVHMLVSPRSALAAADMIATMKKALGNHVAVYEGDAALDEAWLWDLTLHGLGSGLGPGPGPAPGPAPALGLGSPAQQTDDSWNRTASSAQHRAMPIQYVLLLSARMDEESASEPAPSRMALLLPADSSTSSDLAVASRPLGGIAPWALRRVRDYIEANLGARIEIEQLATLTGLSCCHFSRAFKQSTGVSPHRYLTTRRMLKAAELIETTDSAIFEIALEVGFSDQSHFTRVFSAYLGKAPSRFRHQRR